MKKIVRKEDRTSQEETQVIEVRIGMKNVNMKRHRTKKKEKKRNTETQRV